MDGSHRDSEDSSDERDRDPTPVPQSSRRTSSGTQTQNTDQDGEGTVTTTSATTSTSNPPGRQSANTSETNQRRNQNQGSGEPSTAASNQSQPVLESPESPPYRVNTRRSTPGVVTPLVITRRPVVTDTPASPPIEQQSGTAIVTQGTLPVPPLDDTAAGSLYGVTVGETDSEDVEWQPQSGNASSDSWSTENEDDDDDDDDSHDLSSNESTSEEPSTSDGRRASSAGSRQARGRSKSQPSTSDKAGTSSITDAIENIQKKIQKIKQGRSETRNAMETTPRLVSSSLGPKKVSGFWSV